MHLGTVTTFQSALDREALGQRDLPAAGLMLLAAALQFPAMI